MPGPSGRRPAGPGGAIALVVLASLQGDPWRIVSVAIYGVALVILYSVSPLYHSVKGRAKRLLQKLDHLSIYLLIAGSYTPFCLVTCAVPGATLFGIVWGLALIGMAQELKPRSEARILSLVIYATMGWIVLVAWDHCWIAWAARASPGWRRRRCSIPSASSSSSSTIAFALAWHLARLRHGRSALHFVAILRYVLPAP